MIALSASAISFVRARLFVSNITLRYLVLHSLEFAMIRHRSPEGESGRGCVSPQSLRMRLCPNRESVVLIALRADEVNDVPLIFFFVGGICQ